MNQWASSFVTRVDGPKAITDGVSHELLPNQGAGDFESIISELLPQAHRATLVPGAPGSLTLGHALSKCTLFGHGSTYIRTSYESEYLGSFRLTVKGDTVFFFVQPEALQNFFAGHPAYVPEGNREINNKVFGSFLQTLSEDTVKYLANEGLCLFEHATVTDGNIIYIPPGWLVSVATANGKSSHGFKKLCLPMVNPSSLACAKSHVTPGPASPNEIKALNSLVNALSQSKPDESKTVEILPKVAEPAAPSVATASSSVAEPAAPPVATALPSVAEPAAPPVATAAKAPAAVAKGPGRPRIIR